MKKVIYNISSKAPTLCVTLFSIYIFVTLCLNIILDNKFLMNFTEIYTKLPTAIVIIFSIIFVSIIAFLMCVPLKRKREPVSDKKFIATLTLCFVGVFAIQFFITYNIWFRTDWDVAMLIKDAENIAYNRTYTVTSWYYSSCPNNFVLVYVLAFILRIGQLFFNEPYYAILIANMLCVCVSVYLATLCIFKITNNRRVTIIGMVIGAALIAFSPWIVIPYSDTFAMIFPIFSVFAYLYVKPNFPKYLLFCLSITMGYLIKPTVAVILIALLIIEFCRFIENLTKSSFDYKKFISLILALALACGCSFGFNKLVYHIDKTQFNDGLRFSMAHFLMLGSNPETNGGYSSEDVSFSFAQNGPELRKKANYDKVIERIKEMGFVGYTKHLIRKNIINYNDGTFNYGREGTFYTGIRETDSKIATAVRSLYYARAEKNHYSKFALSEQIIWLGVLLCICFCAFGKKSSGEILLSIALIGVSIFLLLFEARSRYLLMFTPLYLILACIGITKMVVCLQKIPFVNDLINKRKERVSQ